ncbi:MAG: isopeptide-forming domain-containing fimbrial protein, partial [Acidobacteriota bacterium]|nr:isopeptide-forming domain-containing fimbrial protein [Acidobacteriota bacterium]
MTGIRYLQRVAGIVRGLAVGIVLLQAPERVTAQALCSTPGKDGPGGTLSGVVNTYYPGTASAAAGSTTIVVGAARGSATTITSGDLLLVIQMQDAAIDSTNTGSYGDGVAGDPGSGYTAANSSGLYEYVKATNAVPAAGGSLTLQGTGTGSGLLNSYTNAAASGTQGQSRFQVVRVPQYSTATLGAGLTASAWNGTTGGVLALDVSTVLSLGSATVSVNGLGFRGGGGRQLAGGAGGSNQDYRVLSILAFDAQKGEGIAGTPAFIYDPGTATVVATGAEGYPNGSSARGAPGTAGGGGTDGNPSANDQNSGGGGGGNGGAGGMGGNSWASNLNLGGFGGVSFPSSVARVVLGGGGGAGSRNNSAGAASSAGPGGGIVMIRAASVSGIGTISADGGVGVAPDNDGGGGGGAGGTILVTTTAGNLTGLTLFARGGRGTDAWATQGAGTGCPTSANCSYHGPGGGGGGGAIFLSAAPTSSNVLGGANGTTTTATNAFGATGGTAGTVVTASTPSQIPGGRSGAECLGSPAPTPTPTDTPTSTPTNTPTLTATQ